MDLTYHQNQIGESTIGHFMIFSISPKVGKIQLVMKLEFKWLKFIMNKFVIYYQTVVLRRVVLRRDILFHFYSQTPQSFLFLNYATIYSYLSFHSCSFMYWHTTMHINSHYMYQRLGIYHWGLVDCYPFILKQLFLPSIYFCLKIKYMKFHFLDLHTLGIWNTTLPNGLAVPDASMHSVKSMKDVLELMNTGLMNRATSATALNERSSRSHRLHLHIFRFSYISIPIWRHHSFLFCLMII